MKICWKVTIKKLEREYRFHPISLSCQGTWVHKGKWLVPTCKLSNLKQEVSIPVTRRGASTSLITSLLHIRNNIVILEWSEYIHRRTLKDIPLITIKIPVVAPFPYPHQIVATKRIPRESVKWCFNQRVMLVLIKFWLEKKRSRVQSFLAWEI